MEKRKWNGQSRGGKMGYLFFVYTIRLLGVRCAYALLALVAVHFIPFAPKATAAVWDYYRKRLGYSRLKAAWSVYIHYYTFGQTLIDKVAIKAGMADRFHFAFENYERFLDIINKDQGVIMVGAHVGCWEAGSAFFGKYGKRINIVMFDTEHEAIKQVLEKSSDARNFKVIPVNEDALQAMIQIKCALNDGEYVCFNGDRYLDKSSAVSFRFLGDDAGFPSGPFRIASKCRVPVVFYYAMREKNRTYRFIFQEAKTDKIQGYEFLIKQYVESLESIVAGYPHQWFNFYRFWEN